MADVGSPVVRVVRVGIDDAVLADVDVSAETPCEESDVEASAGGAVAR